ncbi:MAG: SDR family oxidoreductase [Pirellulales bacterium]
MARKILVTGGAGFIGSHLVHALVERGDQVRVLDNLSTGKRRNLAEVADAIEFVEGDLVDAATVARAVSGVELVYHEAALASVPRSVELPLDTHAACVTGTLTLLDAARRAGVRRLIYAASSSAYGNQPFASKRESDLPDPLSPYGAAKLAAEHYCHAFTATYGFETVALRYFNVFGPRQDADSPYSAVIPLFVTALLSGRRPTIYGDGGQSRDFTFIADVVRGNLLAADAVDVAGRVINLATGRTATLLQLLDTLGRLLEMSIEPIFAPPRAGDVRESLADITLARQYLGYEPQFSLEAGLEQSLDYYRETARV